MFFLVPQGGRARKCADCGLRTGLLQPLLYVAFFLLVYLLGELDLLLRIFSLDRTHIMMCVLLEALSKARARSGAEARSPHRGGAATLPGRAAAR